MLLGGCWRGCSFFVLFRWFLPEKICCVLVYLVLFFKGCVTIEDAQTVILNAPKESSAMKNSERGIGHAVHSFTFSQVDHSNFWLFFFTIMKAEFCNMSCNLIFLLITCGGTFFLFKRLLINY